MQAAVAMTVSEFCAADTAEVRTKLIAAFPGVRLTEEQLDAWDDEVELLQKVLAGLPPPFPPWTVLLEYSPPLSWQRADAVIMTADALVVVEFKLGGRETFSAVNRSQVRRYATEFYWTHPLAEGRRVHALLVATSALDSIDRAHPEDVAPDELPTIVRQVAPNGLDAFLAELAALDRAPAPTPTQCLAAGYTPRPTIVDAAVGLVAALEDPTLTMPLADDQELERLIAALAAVVHAAAQGNEHRVVFISGTPGAGKTLVGLRIVHDPAVVERLRDEKAVPLYLSGNFPLVQVLNEALARDAIARGVTRDRAHMASRALVRMVHDFVAERFPADATAPETHLVVFDEAQRAWDADQLARGPSGLKNEKVSEPEALLRIMARKDWAVVVALVGTGQDINRGEAGVEAWLDAIGAGRGADKQWTAVAPGEIAATAGRVTVTADDSFRLSTSRRALGLPDIADWVDAVLERDVARAADILSASSTFEVRITRELDEAREWLASHDRRFRPGLVASSKAGRLRAYGVELSNDFLSKVQWADWFLERPPSLLSSYALEVAATEFKCQGLELDYVGVCWGWDFVPAPDPSRWQVSRLNARLARWDVVASESRRRWAVNSYRVLLTRARKGMVIWVPRGDGRDASRPVAPMDDTHELLVRSGAAPLPTTVS